MARPPAPAISVIVPAYGVAHLVGDALASLQAQTREDWEAIVVDDGAPDNVRGAVERFAGDPRIRLLQTDNGGLATARNRAAAHARADVISLLDGDDRYMPSYVARMLAALDREPRAAFATCDAMITGLPVREGQRFSAFAPQPPPITLGRVLAREFNVFGSCAIRRAAFEAVGGYDGTLRSAEDLDLWLRLLGAGFGATLVPEPLVLYYRRPDSLSSDTRGLLRAVIRVYRAAAERLAGRPEEPIARTMLARAEQQLAWTDGEHLVREGRVAEGLALLRDAGAHRRSLPWRIAMPLMTLAPSLAGPILRWRERANEGS